MKKAQKNFSLTPEEWQLDAAELTARRLRLQIFSRWNAPEPVAFLSDADMEFMEFLEEMIAKGEKRKKKEDAA